MCFRIEVISRDGTRRERRSNEVGLLYCVLRKAAASLRMDILSILLELPATVGTRAAIVDIFVLRLSRRCFSAKFRDARGLLQQQMNQPLLDDYVRR